jgi:hypothetical protein
MDTMKDCAADAIVRLGLTLALGTAFASIGGGCGDLVGLGGDAPPLATVHVRAVGDVGTIDGELRVAVVWGTQWLPEPLCVLPAESPEVEAVIAAGCRNSLGFTPERVAATVPIVVGADTELPLYELPSADVMVGGLEARIAYASLIVFDDVDRTGTLELSTPIRLPHNSEGPGDDDDGEEMRMSRDVIHGASFVAMTEPDRRLAFREGGYAPTGFYPRRGCGDPPAAFSILSAGGFTLEAAIAATAAGELPAQDPATCNEAELDATVVEITVRDPDESDELDEVHCAQRRTDSSVYYAEPLAEPLPLDDLVYACASIPTFTGEDPIDLVQLVVANHEMDRCRGLTHYTLRGCEEGELVCDHPEWDFVANPPSWWPCPEALP